MAAFSRALMFLALSCFEALNGQLFSDSQCIVRVSPLLTSLQQELQQVFENDVTFELAQKHPFELCLPLPRAKVCLTVPLRRHCYKLDPSKLLVDLVETINDDCNLFRNLDGSIQSLQQLTQALAADLHHPDASGQCEAVQANQLEPDRFWHEYVLKGKPIVIKGYLSNASLARKWNNTYLRQLYADKRVHVKFAPNGQFEGVEPIARWKPAVPFNVPSVVKEQLVRDDVVVVRPATREMTMGELLDYIQTTGNQSATAYLEYTSLDSSFPELVDDLPVPRLSSRLTLRHRNIWLSDGRTLGKLHFDPFENILAMVSGSKTVYLISPDNNTQLQEGHLVEAQLGYDPTTGAFTRSDLHDSTAMVMSPLELDDVRNQKSVLECHIGPGDALFMPAYWWHEVQSSPDVEDHRNLAINEWFEPVFSKEFPCAECKRTFNTHYRWVV
eukprot:TRINITY_DN7648_c0_g1_i1.p1 TRINITY_DN7648_c0_g1~~TRINITY_DN7648_c0_g1_i1.p1  ORF type:complete len:443 (+),score=83.35 TRINITY_DN7648_c0_g1_i1:135-1463(+)